MVKKVQTINERRHKLARAAAGKFTEYHKELLTGLSDCSVAYAMSEVANLDRYFRSTVTAEVAVYDRIRDFSESKIIDFAIRYDNKLQDLKRSRTVIAENSTLPVDISTLPPRLKMAQELAWNEACEQVNEESESFMPKYHERLSAAFRLSEPELQEKYCALLHKRSA